MQVSIVNNRRRCASHLRRAAVNKELGLITNVKLQRISWLIWHLQYDVEIK